MNQTGAYIPDGTRTIQAVTIGATRCYKKYDDKVQGTLFCFNGMRDKIAADLAQIVCVNIPPALLWKNAHDIGCVQQEPPHDQLHQTLALFLQVNQAAGNPKPELVDSLARCYQPENYLFDLWVGNRDRFGNPKNTLIAETATGLTFYLIDFDNSMGHRERPWTDDRHQEIGFNRDDPPVPQFFAKDPRFLESFLKDADRIQRNINLAEDGLISEICGRCGEYYESSDAIDTASVIASGLIFRKQHVMEWARKLIASED